MICKKCKNAIDDRSVYCMYCGEKVVATKREKKEISVPKPRKLKSGKWNIELRKEGVSITEKTPEECTLKARSVRAGYLEIEKQPKKIILGEIIDRYIEKNREVLSPSTIRGYISCRKSRFKDYQDKEITKIDYQEMINREAKKVSAKTVANAWGLVSTALRDSKYPVPEVKTPKIPKKDLDFLDYEELKIFLRVIKGDSIEAAALLALHSLRSSELHALTVENIEKDVIHIRGAEVRGEKGVIKKETNKNSKSTRDVPIMIPRLKDILPDEGKVVQVSRTTINRRLEKICKENGLTVCTIHDLRRSFATLAYHLRWLPKTTQQIGGWANSTVVEEIYEKLSILDKNKDVQKMQRFYGLGTKKVVKLRTTLRTKKNNG